MPNKVVDVQKRENYAVVTIQNPPYNVLTARVFEGLRLAFTELQTDPSVKAVMLTGGQIFSVGADVSEIYKIAQGKDKKRCLEVLEKTNAVANLIAGLGKPTIAVIDGMCLGGGNELAMACRVRVATPQAKFGQPEINLGIMPGMGATQRLPRLVGTERALMMLVSGASISAKDAKEYGLVGVLLDGRNIPAWIAENMRQIGTEGLAFLTLWVKGYYDLKPRHEWNETLLNSEGFKRVAASKSPESVTAITNALRFGSNHELEESLKEEQRLFAELLMTESALARLSGFINKKIGG